MPRAPRSKSAWHSVPARPLPAIHAAMRRRYTPCPLSARAGSRQSPASKARGKAIAAARNTCCRSCCARSVTRPLKFCRSSIVNPAHRGVHQIGGRDERVPSARTTARTRSYGRASSTMLKGPCAARRTWRKPPPSFSTSVNFASPAWAPRASPTSCASDVGTQIMVEAL
jgi:hypothetical protein